MERSSQFAACFQSFHKGCGVFEIAACRGSETVRESNVIDGGYIEERLSS